MRLWKVDVELNMNASNVVTIEVKASTESKARKRAEIIAKKKHNAFFTQINSIKFIGYKANEN